MSDFVIRPITGQPIASVTGPVRAVLSLAPVGQPGGGGAAQDGADLARNDGRDRPLPRRATLPGGSDTDVATRPPRSAEATPEPPVGSELARIALSTNKVGPPPAFPINVLEAEAQRRATRDRAEAIRPPVGEGLGAKADRSQDHAPHGLAEAAGTSPAPERATMQAPVQAPYPGHPVSAARPASGTGPPPRVDLHL
jgi:hypothetical protein